MDTPAVRVGDEGAVRRLTLCRPDAYNTITPQLRDELGAALDEAQHDREVRVVLLDAEGPAFCAGYDLGWSTAAQAEDGGSAVELGRSHGDPARAPLHAHRRRVHRRRSPRHGGRPRRGSRR